MRSHRKARRSSGPASSYSVESLENRRLLSGGASFAGGAGNDIAYAADGTLYVAYFNQIDSTHGDLRYGIRNPDGTWRANGSDGGIIDNLGGASTAQVGLYVSVALDSTGKPGVAYFDGYNAKLRYAHFNGTTWDNSQAFTGTGKRGYYPSLAYLSDKPTITDYFKTGTSSGYLEVDQAPGVTPSSPSVWSTTIIDNSGNAGRYSSLAYNAGASKWGVSYDDSGTSIGGRYVETSGTSVTSGWGSVASIPLASGGHASNAVWTSLTYDGSNRPAIAYYDNTDFNLNFAHRNGTGSTWQTMVLSSNNTTGKYPTLLFESSQFRVTYYNESGGQVEVQKGGDIGGGWSLDAPLVVGGGSELKIARRSGATAFAWSAGGTLYVNDDTTGVGWTKQSGSSAYGGRTLHTSVAFDPNISGDAGAKMWVIGGLTGSIKTNEVDYSDDGLTWHMARSNGATNGFTARDAQSSVVFDNGDTSNPGAKMWVIGGQTGNGTPTNVGDVWWSLGGTSWTQESSGGTPVDIGARQGSSAVVFNGKMFVVGGLGNSGVYPTNTVESSSDGVTWTGAAVTPFQRYGAVTLAYNGSIYVIGGIGSDVKTYQSDSTGASWSLDTVNVTGIPSVTFGNTGTGMVYDGKMWIINGLGAYWSTDGVGWTLAPADPDGVTPFDSRTGMTSVVLAQSGVDKMWVLGGYISQGGLTRDDVWNSN
jgi:hypothetical protein